MRAAHASTPSDRGIQRQIGRDRFFEFARYARETRQLAAFGCGVHTFFVACLQHRHRRVQIHLDESVRADHVARAAADLLVRHDECGQADHARIVDQLCGFGGAAHVFGTIRRREAEVAAHAEAEVLTIEHSREPAHVEQASFDRVCDDGFAGFRQAGHAAP